MIVKTTGSSVIRQVAYNPGVVFITFKSGAEYAYAVPRKRAFTNFTKAKSVGKYFNRVFKKNYGPGELVY
jgi:hypothetical protein